ncbi:MAG: TadE family protein [Nocardioides sp.]
MTTTTRCRACLLSRRSRSDRGSMAVEMVLIVPVIFAFVLFIVFCGRLVSYQGDVDATARDAARAVTLTRTLDSSAMDRVVSASLESRCDPARLIPTQTTVRVDLVCHVPLSDLGLVGLHGTKTIRASSTVPLDTYRSYQ